MFLDARWCLYGDCFWLRSYVTSSGCSLRLLCVMLEYYSNSEGSHDGSRPSITGHYHALMQPECPSTVVQILPHSLAREKVELFPKKQFRSSRSGIISTSPLTTATSSPAPSLFHHSPHSLSYSQLDNVCQVRTAHKPCARRHSPVRLPLDKCTQNLCRLLNSPPLHHLNWARNTSRSSRTDADISCSAQSPHLPMHQLNGGQLLLPAPLLLRLRVAELMSITTMPLP